MKLSANLKNASRAALQWRLLVIWLAAALLPTLLLALPMWSTLSGILSHSVHAPQLAKSLDVLALADLMGEFKRNNLALQAGGIGAAALALLLSPLLTGVIASAGRAQETATFRQLFAGGVSEYPRMFRMLLWAVVPLGLALALGGAVADSVQDIAEKASLESTADAWSLCANVLGVLLLALANLTLDAGRAQLAIDRRRTSAVKAWWSGLKLLLRRPAAMFGSYLLLTVSGLLLAGLFALARFNVEASNGLLLVAGFLLAQLVVLAMAWMRAARLFALMTLSATNR
ncbi:hypothetical protein SAMN05518865_113130 [Duganella sp. CF458]|uniref:hypothetical protein n=1 Tax=Duganella sp. CF458 TaxID=1884368 RepID=UPI0008E02F22|nr:hypothetical protein [Duganella sp. CF458]SFG52871.1 hypothetical protein SAMN05518865_113130 [Duganella sp. CF458]